MIWDTGSGGYLVRSTDCTTCSGGDKFDISQSTTFAYKDPVQYDGVQYLGGTALYGKLAYDTVCPNPDTNSCASNFKFVAISTASGLKDYKDGIIGLWSGNKSSYTDEEEMIMHKMVADSTITEKVFSLYLTNQSSSSYIDFGAPNTAVMSDENAIVWIDILSENLYWSA